ncbi:hypothetical protein AYK26_02990 [Euryarchaeota archaeon SM23-78]|nr:MAG: hypothetical protein AYK26_02990 [Euryarchaeota archaeon SM23-78]MBW3000410.1 magnesium/cobalt transporter CorA [Candidatus Woesearchaeota archaeon]
MIRIFVFKNRKIFKNPSQKDLQRYLKDKKAAIWVDFEKPDDKDYVFIEDNFDFHHLSIEDCKKAIELPKIDTFETYLFIVLYSVPERAEKPAFNKREIDFFLGNNFLITLHNHKSPGVEHMIEKVDAAKNGMSITADFLMYEVIDHFVDLHFPLLDEWEDHIEKLEEEIIQGKHKKDTLKQIMSIKKEVLNMRKSIAPQIDVINKFTKKDFPFIQSRTSMYFKDVYDHLMRIYSELEAQRDLLKNAFDAHTTIISKQMTETSNKMNQVMQKLTTIATIFMPLTFIAGVYGMNFWNMPELKWPFGYYLILIIMLIVGIMMYLFFKKRKWA